MYVCFLYSLVCLHSFSFIHFVLLYVAISIFISTNAHIVFPVSPSGACTLLRNALKPGPSSVTSATSGAWPRRNLFKSTGHCTERFPLIYICLTLWLTEPISLSRPWRRRDTHLQVRWGGMGLIDWQTVTEPLGHCKIIPLQWETHIMLVHERVRVCARRCLCAGVYVLTCFLRVRVVILIQITHCTLSVVTGKESGCQVGPAHIYKDWQN